LKDPSKICFIDLIIRTEQTDRVITYFIWLNDLKGKFSINLPIEWVNSLRQLPNLYLKTNERFQPIAENG